MTAYTFVTHVFTATQPDADRIVEACAPHAYQAEEIASFALGFLAGIEAGK
jgi:hypothetical protein